MFGLGRIETGVRLISDVAGKLFGEPLMDDTKMLLATAMTHPTLVRGTHVVQMPHVVDLVAH